MGLPADNELRIAAQADLVLALASLVLSPKPKVSGSFELKAVAIVFKEESSALLASKKDSVCEVSLGCDAAQLLLCTTLLLISVMFENFFLHVMCRHLTLNMCSLVMRSRFHLTELEAHLSHKCGRLRLCT